MSHFCANLKCQSCEWKVTRLNFILFKLVQYNLGILILLRLKIPFIFSGGLEGIQKQHKHQDGDRGSIIVTLYMPVKRTF